MPGRQPASPLVVSALVALAMGCDGVRTGDAAAGRPDSIQRLISLLPSATELVVALGAAERLAARTDQDSAPELAHLPSVGGSVDASAERIAALAPDLVLVWDIPDARSLRWQLERMGVRTRSVKSETLVEMRAAIRELGALLGLAARAESLTAAIDDTLAAVRADRAGAPEPSVFVLLWPDPPITASTGTFLHEIIEIAGGRNAFADLPSRWPTVSLEAIVLRDPDIVLWPRGGPSRAPADLAQRAGWREVPAVRAGRVVVVDADLFTRSGPRVARAARVMARTLDSVGGRPPRVEPER